MLSKNIENKLLRYNGWHKIFEQFRESNNVSGNNAIDFIVWVQDNYEIPEEANTTVDKTNKK